MGFDCTNILIEVLYIVESRCLHMESGRECSIPQSSVIYSRHSDSKMSTRFSQLSSARA